MRTWERNAAGALTFTDLSPKNRISSENDYRQAKIDVVFARYDHQDLEAFDGSGGMVAHSGYPPDGIVHFDASENWTVSDNSDPEKFVDLRYVSYISFCFCFSYVHTHFHRWHCMRLATP